MYDGNADLLHSEKKKAVAIHMTYTPYDGMNMDEIDEGI